MDSCWTATNSSSSSKQGLVLSKQQTTFDSEIECGAQIRRDLFVPRWLRAGLASPNTSLRQSAAFFQNVLQEPLSTFSIARARDGMAKVIMDLNRESIALQANPKGPFHPFNFSLVVVPDRVFRGGRSDCFLAGCWFRFPKFSPQQKMTLLSSLSFF